MRTERAMNWYFSRALGVIGLLAAVVRVAMAVILGDAGVELLEPVGTGILFIVGGMLAGAIIDVTVRARRRERPREPGRAKPARKR